MNPADVKAFADFMGITTKEHGDELAFKQCPSCHGGTHGDEYTFCINMRTGAANCVRESCHYHGHFVEVCRDYNYPLDMGVAREYKILPQPSQKIQPRQQAIDYLKSRGISAVTANDYEITVRKDNPNMLVFPFYDENGVLVAVKYRNTKFRKGIDKNKEWFEKDTQPILFGMKQCADFSRLIITEGQLDSLSVAEAGFKNAVSVPTGAGGFTWYVPSQEWIEKFDEIVVFGDYERGKITLVDGIRARFPKTVKVVRKCDYLGEKDANDILRKYGKNAIVRCIENAEVPKIENVIDLADVEYVDLNKLPKIPTGFEELDRAIGGLFYGTLTILSGKRGNGKSTFMSQLICSAIESGNKVFAYSGELPNYFFKSWLDLQLAGKENLDMVTDENGETRYAVKPDVEEKLRTWYRGKISIYDNSVIPEEFEDLLTTVEKVIRDYGVNLVCLDNLMTAMDVVTVANNLNLAQSNFVGELKKLAMKYNVAIVLVAHTKKTPDAFDNDSVSGSGDITNKADIVLGYSRDKEDDNDDITSTLKVMKNRMYGKLATIPLHFNSASKRVYGKGSKRDYSWVNIGKYEEVEELPF